nr:hypothetical protein [uncultured Erythrobacter sp.]
MGKKPPDAMVSLKTTDRREAERKMVAVRAKQHEDWEEIRRSSWMPPNIPSRDELIEAATVEVHQRFIEIHLEKLRGELKAETNLSEVAEKRRRKRVQADLLPTPSDKDEMQRLAVKVSKKMNWNIQAGGGLSGERWDEFLELVTKAVQIARARISDYIEGKDTNMNPRAVVQRLGGRHTAEDTSLPSESIMSLFEQYQREKLRKASVPTPLKLSEKL